MATLQRPLRDKGNDCSTRSSNAQRHLDRQSTAPLKKHCQKMGLHPNGCFTCKSLHRTRRRRRRGSPAAATYPCRSATRLRQRSANCYQPESLFRYSTLLLIFCSVLHLAVAEITISSLLVPDFVENGTSAAVILDCVYAFDEEDRDSLVVKWFLNEDPTPIYQWLPELGTRVPSARLEGRVAMNFAVTRDPFTRYRALRLMNPTTDLSGRYTCQVMSMFGHATKEKNMIVYAPPKSVNFKFKKTMLRDGAEPAGTSLAQHAGRQYPVPFPPPPSYTGPGRMTSDTLDQHQHNPHGPPPHAEHPSMYPIVQSESMSASSMSSGHNSGQMPPLGGHNQNQNFPPLIHSPLNSELNSQQYDGSGSSGGGSPRANSQNLNGGRLARTTPGAILRCDVDLVYPVPSVTIYRVNLDGSDPRNLPLVIDTRPSGLNSFNISVLAQVRDAELLSDPLVVSPSFARQPYPNSNQGIHNFQPAPSRAMMSSGGGQPGSGSGRPNFPSTDNQAPSYYRNNANPSSQQQLQQQYANSRKRDPQSIFECLVVWGSPTVKYERKRRLAYHIELTDGVGGTTAGSESSRHVPPLVPLLLLILLSAALLALFPFQAPL